MRARPHPHAMMLAACATALLAAGFLSLPAQAQVAVFCQATWRFADGMRTFSGLGASEAEALEAAGARCRAEAPEGSAAICASRPVITCGVTPGVRKE